jgi:hypothetical protein
MKRYLWLSGTALLFLTLVGCGDVFRPIIIPNPPVFPNPRAAHTVMSLNDNGAISPGSVTVVDVSGDTIVSVANVGVSPVHAVQQTASQVLVVNQATTSAGADSLSKIIFSGTTINSTTTNPATISLPPNSAPNFVATTETGQAYVLLPNYSPSSVGVVNTLSNNLFATMPVGNNPWAMAETLDRNKLYVANRGDGTISAFNTVDRSTRTITGSLTSAPIWLSARSDSQRVFVLESNGTLAYLDTSATSGPDVLTETSISIPGVSTCPGAAQTCGMFYDGQLNRLYIPGGNQLAVVDVSGTSPQLLAKVTVPVFSLLNQSPVNAVAVAVTVLPDGSRAYVTSLPATANLALPSQLTISSVQGDGTTATYTYTLTAGHDLTPGATITVAGTADGFDGTFQVSTVPSGTSTCPTTNCFQVLNSTSTSGSAVSVSGTASGENIFPQVTVVNTTSNTIKTTVGIAGFLPYETLCASTRFRFVMAAAGDSSRAYMSACDGGNINVINTDSDTNVMSLQAPFSARAPIPPSTEPPPQNPVYLIAGP